MSSSSYNIGINDERTSSRILNPPGGKVSDIFGNGPEPPTRLGRRLVPQKAGTMTGVLPGGKPENEVTEVEVAVADSTTLQDDTGSPSKPTPQDDTPATPEPTAVPAVTAEASPKQETESAAYIEPPKRVRVPPGGFSSKLW